MNVLQSLYTAQSTYGDVLNAILRYLAPAIAAFLIFRCVRPLLTFRREPEIWAWLCMTDGKKLPITHWENVIGRAKRSDIVIDFPTVSRNHAVLTRYDDGSWTITDADSSGGVLVNGKRVRIRALQEGDVISLGGVEMTLQPISRRQEQRLAELRTKGSSFIRSFLNVLILTILQVLMCLAFLLGAEAENGVSILLGFGGVILCQWALLLFYVCIRRTSFEVETLAFFLCTLGMAVIATAAPQEAMKQLIAMLIGIMIFLIIGWSLRDLERAKKFRYLAAVAGIGFLLITLVFGKEYNGAKNWLVLGPLSIQPSELSKLCFVFVGASTMDRLMTKRNLILLIVYSVVMCGCLALMNDFGAALIFFCAFLVIAYLRSGSVGTIGLAVTALIFAGVMILKIAPHALDRFAVWRNVWTNEVVGWQQRQALMGMAAGGFFGLGAGQGKISALPVPACDTDIIVATVTEEWGLIMAILMILCIVSLAVFAVRSASVGRSSFYTIGACTAASILLMQAILNALGTVDVLPLTGVTFPFVSNGGSSMMCVWGLLAFIKAADTRQNASFAIRLNKKGVPEDE